MVFSKKIFAGILAVSLSAIIFVAFSLATSTPVFWPTPTAKPTPTPTIKPTPTPTIKPTPTPIPTPAPKTEILSIDAAAFGYDLGYSYNAPLIYADTTQNTNYFTALCLPNKAVITKIAFTVNDNNTGVCAQLWLMKQDLNDEQEYLLCMLNSTDSQGGLRYQYVSTNCQVDNSQFAYFLQLILYATPQGSGHIHVEAAQITYTYYP
jgi:hypothetical protein